MLDQLYENIGEKIKTLAKWVFIAEAISAIIGGIALLIEGDFLVGLVLIIVGPVAAWVSTWLLYAFGELVEKSCIMNEKLYIVTQHVTDEHNRIRREDEEKAEREAEVKAKREAEEKTKREAEAKAKHEAEERARQKAEKKEKTLADKLRFALAYQTDEGMNNYLKTINDPAVAEILNGPAHLVRAKIEKALNEM